MAGTCCSRASALAFHPLGLSGHVYYAGITHCLRLSSSPSTVVRYVSLAQNTGQSSCFSQLMSRISLMKTKNELLQWTIASPQLITGQIYAVTEEAMDLVRRFLNSFPPAYSWVTLSTMGEEQYSSPDWTRRRLLAITASDFGGRTWSHVSQSSLEFVPALI